MIERVPIRRDETSKYYHHNVRLAEEWEAFCKEANGSISGLVNSYTLELKLSFNYKNKAIVVNASRETTNISGGVTLKSNLSKHTSIVFEGINMGDDSWKIYPRKKWLHSFIGLLSNVEPLSYNKNYSLLSSNRMYDFKQHMPSSLFTTIEEITELRSIHGSNDSLKIAYLI